MLSLRITMSASLPGRNASFLLLLKFDERRAHDVGFHRLWKRDLFLPESTRQQPDRCAVTEPVLRLCFAALE
jgi:hypothetical protein